MRPQRCDSDRSGGTIQSSQGEDATRKVRPQRRNIQARYVRREVCLVSILPGGDIWARFHPGTKETVAVSSGVPNRDYCHKL